MTFQELEDKQDTDKEESSLTDHSPTYDYTIKENDVEVKLEEIHDYNEINLQKDDSLLTSIPQIADNLNVNQVIVKQEKDAEWEDTPPRQGSSAAASDSDQSEQNIEVKLEEIENWEENPDFN